jgi:hypothetical protein
MAKPQMVKPKTTHKTSVASRGRVYRIMAGG